MSPARGAIELAASCDTLVYKATECARRGALAVIPRDANLAVGIVRLAQLYLPGPVLPAVLHRDAA